MGRPSLSSVFDILDDSRRGALRKRRQPSWTRPMLATLTRDRFSDPDWIYERKLDGVRSLAFSDGRSPRLVSRNRRDQSDSYPELVEVLRSRSQVGDYVVDGEIVAFEGRLTSFSRLQQRLGIDDPDRARRSGVTVTLYLFDVLHLEGHDVTKLPLHDRKRLLKRSFSFGGRLRLTPHRVEEGEAYLEQACRKGWEGLIAKRADSVYEHTRSRAWLKLKCDHRQEFVIGGYTEPRGSRRGFGALLVGTYEKGELRYAGKVGTGYDDTLLDRLAGRLGRLERKTSPFDPAPRETGVHWTTPSLVAEIGFTEWTDAGKLRHPRFLGLRDDKSPERVHRERPVRRT